MSFLDTYFWREMSPVLAAVDVRQSQDPARVGRQPDGVAWWTHTYDVCFGRGPLENRQVISTIQRGPSHHPTSYVHRPWWSAGVEDGAVGAGLDARGEGDVDGRLGGDHVHAHQLGDAPATGNRDPVMFGTEQWYITRA